MDNMASRTIKTVAVPSGAETVRVPAELLFPFFSGGKASKPQLLPIPRIVVSQFIQEEFFLMGEQNGTEDAKLIALLPGLTLPEAKDDEFFFTVVAVREDGSVFKAEHHEILPEKKTVVMEFNQTAGQDVRFFDISIGWVPSELKDEF